MSPAAAKHEYLDRRMFTKVHKVGKDIMVIVFFLKKLAYPGLFLFNFVFSTNS